MKIRRASAMSCKVTTPVNPNGSSWRRPCASDGSKIQMKRQHSPCSKQDHEDMIIESPRIRTVKSTEKTHKDHIADQNQVSIPHYAMEFPAVNGVVDKVWDKWRSKQWFQCGMVIRTTIPPVDRTLPQL